MKNRIPKTQIYNILKKLIRASKILLLIVFFMNFFVLKSSSKKYVLNRITTANGLPQNDIKSILQDSKGFMWIGTNDGLIRYDGYKFEKFEKKNINLDISLVHNLFEDNKKNIWICTDNEGLFLYVEKTEKFINVSQYFGSEVELHEYINEIVQDNKGNIWVSANNKIYRIEYNLKKNKFKITRRVVFSGILRDIEIINNGKIFISSIEKDYLYDIDADKKKEVLKDAGTRVNLFQKYNEKYYGLVNGFLYSFDLRSNKRKKLLKLKIANFFFSKNGDLWMTNSNGIYYLNSSYLFDDSKITQYSKDRIARSRFFQDNYGCIWIGSYRAGIYLLKPNEKPFKTFSKRNVVNALYEDDKNNFWYGVDGEIFKNGKNLNDRDVNDLEEIYCITQDFEKNIWIGTQKGIITLKNSKLVEPAFDSVSINSVRAIQADSCYMWFATYSKGLFLYNIKEKSIVQRFNGGKNSELKKIVRNVYKDKNSNIWICTSKGLGIILKKERFSGKANIKWLKRDDGYFIDNYIIPIFQSKDGAIWFGTIGDGLKKITKINEDYSVKIKSFTIGNGLSNNTIESIEEDNNGNLWISTNNGLNKLNIKSNDIFNYDRNDGLQDNEFNELSCVKLSDNRIAFGGVMGMTIFDPIEIKVNKFKPSMLIYGLQVDDRYIKYDSLINLKFNQNNIIVDFAAIHFSSSNKIKYKYRLDGFDKRWTLQSYANRKAKYTNLSPGKYIFKVKACNGDKLWSDQVCCILIIENPIWLKWYAYFFYVLLLSFIIYSSIRIYKKKQDRLNQIVLNKIEKEQILELSKMKMQFFTNVSHEFRTPLTLISSPLQKIMEDDDMDKKLVKKNLNIIKHNTSILLNLINQLMDFSKGEETRLVLRKMDMVSFAYSVFMQFETWAQEMEISIDFSSSVKSLEMSFDPLKIEEVLYNIFSNAIKNTAKQGKIYFEIEDNEKGVVISVTNSGYIAEEKTRKHLFDRLYSVNGTGIGLFLTKKYVELHNGKITFETSKEDGTRFDVFIPFVKKIDIVKKEIDLNEEYNLENKPILNLEDLEKHKRKTILIVEDNLELLNELKEIFIYDYMVFTAQNGLEGLRVCDSKNISIILSDIMMPIMDGFEFCHEIKNNTNTSHIPFVMLTADNTSETHKKGLCERADAYCTKPFDNNILKQTVKSLLDNREILIDKFKNDPSFDMGKIATNDVDYEFLKKLIMTIEENLTNRELSVTFLTEKLAMNRTSLNQKIKDLTGNTTNVFIRKIRLKKASSLLKSNNMKISEVAFSVGFNDLKYFRKCFKEEYGVTASEFIKV